MGAKPQPIPEWRDVGRDAFANEVFTSYRPAVLKGVVADWPAVRQARHSTESPCGYLDALDNGAAVDAIMIPALARGRIFYNDDLSGFNFTRERLTISAVNEQLLRYAKFQNRPAVAVQSALISDCLPGFAADNRLGLLDETVAPRIWLGNAVVTPAHFDESNNIAAW